jgi:hypothetical protein
MTTKYASYQKCLGINNRTNREDVKSPAAPKPFNPKDEDVSYELSAAENIDIDHALMPSRRAGFEEVDTTPTYSLWSNQNRTLAYCVRNSFLCLINMDYTFTAIKHVLSNDFVFQETPDGIYVTNGQVIYMLNEAVVSDLPIVTQNFKAQIPAGSCMEYFRGRLYVAVGSVLWFSDAFRFFQRDMRYNFKAFSDDIELVAATVDGLYVAAGGITYFLTGDNPHKFDLRPIAGFGAIHGSRTYISGTRIKEGLYGGIVPVWASSEGPCYGFPAGKLSTPMSSKYIMPAGLVGASIVRPRTDKTEGYTQVITTIR